MKIEIWSDVVCPWCYIGKRRLEMALDRLPHWQETQVVWRSFELEPDFPRLPPGTLEEVLMQKYDVSREDAAAMNARVTAVAREVGLDYRLDAARPGNTFDAHRLLHYADSRQLGDRASERLMQAYFSEAFPVGERDALVKIAPEFGITTADALAILESNAYAREVRADEERAVAFGITSVPFFLVDEQYAIPGAESVEVFSDVLQRAWAES